MVLVIILIHQFSLWNKTKRGGIYTITFTCRFRTVIKDMAKMRISVLAAHLDPFHSVAYIFYLYDIASVQGFGKARPSGSGVIFIR